MLRILPALVTVFLVCSSTFSQTTGRINLRVINQKNEGVPSASVQVQGLSVAGVADVEGRLSLQLERGRKYVVTVTSVGYKTKIIDDVEIRAGDDARDELEIVLETAEKNTLEGVVVRSSVRRENTVALINLQKNNPAVSSGIAADFIRRTPDRSTGEVLKRVSGASIQDNKFVIIRGLSDRYNAAFINGAQLPSSEPDKRAFSFDVIPSFLIDNIIINKTATPDLTGEFAGGLVQVTTKDVPAKTFLNVSASFGYNTQSTFNDFRSNPRNGLDWLGFDDGTRKFPSGFPSTPQEYRALAAKPGGLDQQLELSRLFKSQSYNQVTNSALPIQTYSVAYGKGRKFKNYEGSFGTVLSVIYRNSQLNYDVSRKFYEEDGTIVFDYADRQNRYATSLGALANFTYVTPKHKIAFKNFFNQFFEDNFYFRSGPQTSRLGYVNLWSSFLNQRSLYSGQLEGEHQITKSNLKLRWNGGYSINYKTQPDLRTQLYVQPLSDPSEPFEMDPDDTRRFDSKLQDHSVVAGASLLIPFDMFNEKQTLKAGGSTLIRVRDFQSRILRYIPANLATFDGEKSRLPYDEIFLSENIATDGFVLDDFTNNEDEYFGISTLNAGYLMFDNKFNDRLRLIWGARLEYFEQFLRTVDRSAEEIVINKVTWDFLPSVNLTIGIKERQNLRFSVSKTVSRPEFREIAPFQFFDYESNYGVSGDPDLERAQIYNGDIRYEIYPGAGEAITLGAFYKRFVKPIEFRLDPGSNADRRLYFYQNAKDADSYGAELEIRKNMSFLGSSPWLEDLSLFANLTYIFSQVRFTDQVLGKDVSADRPVQGQSPYLINTGLQYTSKTSGFNASVLYNRIGQRLALVGYGSLGFPDVYEKPRDMVDIQVAKRIISNRAEIKLTVSDIFNQKYLFYENLDNSTSYDKSIDRIFTSYTPGVTFTIGFAYDFNLK
jgi:outer membrane receptor for ferrienterochelin and colicin